MGTQGWSAYTSRKGVVPLSVFESLMLTLAFAGVSRDDTVI